MALRMRWIKEHFRRECDGYQDILESSRNCCLDLRAFSDILDLENARVIRISWRAAGTAALI